MKGYILAIAGAVLLLSVVTVIAPPGKMGKFIKGAARLMLLAVMLTPLFGLAQTEPPKFLGESAVYLDEGYLSCCIRRLEEEDEKEVEAFLLEEYGLEGEASVLREREAYFPRRKISVRLLGIFAEDERIHIMTRVREGVEKEFGAETEVS